MSDSASELDALKSAIAHLGSQPALARLCNVSQPAVSNWVNKIGRIPPEHVLKVEAATGISRHDLRPDIYPRDAVAAGPGAGGSSQQSPSRAEPADTPDSLSGLTA